VPKGALQWRSQHTVPSTSGKSINIAVTSARRAVGIATRIKAEIYMIAKIADDPAVAAITKNQTFNLMKLFKEGGLGDKKDQKILKQVHLMTPENIHLNSFMFEPILDMSSEHLKRLFGEVSALK
jgi:hypothetical protein